MLTYPYCNYASQPSQPTCCNTRSMFDWSSRVNVAHMMTYNPLIYDMLNAYVPPKPKSGRKVYRDLGECWIVIAFESGPLKLLELELK